MVEIKRENTVIFSENTKYTTYLDGSKMKVGDEFIFCFCIFKNDEERVLYTKKEFYNEATIKNIKNINLSLKPVKWDDIGKKYEVDDSRQKVNADLIFLKEKY